MVVNSIKILCECACKSRDSRDNQHFSSKIPKCFNAIISGININTTKDPDFSPLSIVPSNVREFIRGNLSLENAEIRTEHGEEGKLRYRNGSFSLKKSDGLYLQHFRANVVLSGIITYNDLQEWDSIKALRVGEFIHRKLEMFDFSYEKAELKIEELTV